MCNFKWENNAIQFPRLLAEIMATQELDMAALAESMDLSLDQVNALFDRADQEWEAIKAGAVPQMPTKEEILEVVIGQHKALERVLHEYNPDSTEAEWLGESNELVIRLTGRCIGAIDLEPKQACEAAGGNAG